MQEIQSLHIDFQIKATDSSCLQHHPSVVLRTDSILSANTGTTTTEGEMKRIGGDIEFGIPSSESCVYELVQSSLTLQLPTPEILDEYSQIGHQLNINWEKSVAVDDAWGDFVLELNQIPKSVAGISLVDGIWNSVEFLLQMIRLNGVVEAVCEHLTSLITNPKHKRFYSV